MKKVLFVLEKFYPDNSANINCLKSIIEEFQANNYQVDVLTYRQKKELQNYDVLNSINVYRVNDYYNITKNIFLKKTLFRLTRKLLLNIKIVLKGKILNRKNNYNYIIASSYPFVMDIIAQKIARNSESIYISYQLDPYTFNKNLKASEIDKRLKVELRTLEKASKIFLPLNNYEENLKTNLKVLKNKYYPLEFPLIKPIEYSHNKCNSKKEITFVYTGTFYEGIRVPNNMLEFFDKISMDFKLNIYYIGSSTIDETLNKYKKRMSNKVELFKGKSKEECDKALRNADIIINIGNETSNQIPSKIYEYISLRKPIINFYSIEDDSSKKVLEKYDLVINIFKEFNETDIHKFESFCRKNYAKIVSIDNIKKNYKLASDVAKEFVREVEKL